MARPDKDALKALKKLATPYCVTERGAFRVLMAGQDVPRLYTSATA